jgi:hypothetical protein
MNKCKRNILLIFGYLLIVAFLIVPCSKYDVPKPPPGFVSEQPLYVFPKKYSFVPIPILIQKIIKSNKEVKISKKGIIESKEESRQTESVEEEKYAYILSIYRLKLDFLLTEITVILLMAGFVYILFCIVLKRYEKKKG